VKTKIAIGPWLVSADAEATRLAYRRIERSPADECVCDYCKNFVAVRNEAYPPEVIASFDLVGIDWRKELEILHCGDLPSGLHVYEGLFQLAGHIESGPDSWIILGQTSKQTNFYRLTSRFEIGVLQIEKASSPFSELPVVQVEFSVELPWRCGAPESDEA